MKKFSVFFRRSGLKVVIDWVAPPLPEHIQERSGSVSVSVTRRGGGWVAKR